MTSRYGMPIALVVVYAFILGVSPSFVLVGVALAILALDHHPSIVDSLLDRIVSPKSEAR